MKEMIMAKEYKVKLAQGFNAAGRRRAGLNLIKGETLVTELTAEQLSELQADVWVVVQEADAKDAGEGSEGGEGGQVDPYEGVSFKDLKAQAVEAGIDVKGMKSRADVIAALDAAAAGSEGGEEDEEETLELSEDMTLELSEDMTLEDLKAVAVDQGVAAEVVEAATDETKADLIKAIEEAAEKTEE
jgi:phenylpyruvate tautomerase PptA (4-oxalocrotonate tautomerase family)